MFIRKRIINGHTYYSREERYWCPITKKVKSRYLGRVDWGYTLRGDGRQPSSEEVNAEIARKEQAERNAKEREFSQAKFLEGAPRRFGPNDRVRLTNKATGVNAERTITKIMEDGTIVVRDDISGIPYKFNGETTGIDLVKAGDHNAPLPKMGITFGELWAAEEREEAERTTREAKLSNPSAEDECAESGQDTQKGD